MKKHILPLFLYSLLLSITACKKEKANETTNDSEIAAHSDDQSQFSNELDVIANEGNLAIESQPDFA